jgi:hypothetical protein
LGDPQGFCQRVLEADRAGQPAVDLRTLPLPKRDNEFIEIDGLVLPAKHPSILFGDGGAIKSYFSLYCIGRLAHRGARVAIFDWELDGEDHRDRLERLFGTQMPSILYARCERPLVYEVDRLRRIVRESGIEFIVYDSIAFACDGPPESAETASRYFRAVRQIGGGSLHIAHINKSDAADQKPFGSSFWHNGARSTWYAQRADDSSDSETIRLGLFNRKANLGRLTPPIAFSVTFTEEHTIFRKCQVADNPELASKLSVGQRMAALLRNGSLSYEQIAEEIEAKLDTVTRIRNPPIQCRSHLSPLSPPIGSRFFQCRQSGFEILDLKRLRGVVRMLSAARTRVDGCEFASTMIFASVDTAALDIWCSRAIDCEKAARLVSRYARWKSASFIQRYSVRSLTPTDLAELTLAGSLLTPFLQPRSVAIEKRDAAVHITV